MMVKGLKLKVKKFKENMEKLKWVNENKEQFSKMMNEKIENELRKCEY